MIQQIIALLIIVFDTLAIKFENTVHDFECVALGHKEKVNTVLAHDYYAEKVIDDLKQMDGWESGLVTVSQKKVRDPNTSLVIGLYDIHKEIE